MKIPALCCAAVASMLAVGSAGAEWHRISSGSHCQPEQPVHAAQLSYAEGAVTNIGRGTVVVVCPLPASVPGHVATAASVALIDAKQRWGRCQFRNVWPGLAGQVRPVQGVPASPHVGVAELEVDNAVFMPHVVICPLLSEQRLYALTLVVEPI